MANPDREFMAKKAPFGKSRLASEAGDFNLITPDRPKKTVSVVIPAFNEELSVRETVIELSNLFEVTDISAEIIVVDDGSKDKTAREARAAGARVIQHRSNRGYGASLKSGIIAASNDIIGITDADGTYPAKYFPEMLAELESADMVVGSRTGA